MYAIREDVTWNVRKEIVDALLKLRSVETAHGRELSSPVRLRGKLRSRKKEIAQLASAILERIRSGEIGFRSGSRIDPQRAAQAGSPLLHTDEPKVIGLGQDVGPGRESEPRTIVTYREGQSVGAAANTDDDALSLGVLHGVVQCLLSDAVGSQFDFRRAPAYQTLFLQVNLGRGPLRRLAH